MLEVFKMLHQPISKESLISFKEILEKESLEKTIREKIKLPSKNEIKELITYLEVNSNDLYINFNNVVNPFCYYDEIYTYIDFISLNKEDVVFMKVKERIKFSKELLSKKIQQNDWLNYFTIVDKPARIDAFKHFYNKKLIPKDQVLESFVLVYTMNEFGLGELDNKLITDVYSFNSQEHDERLKNLNDIVHQFYIEDTNYIRIYRGCTKKGIHGYSWTLDLDTAYMFANRNSGEVYEGKILIEDVLDFINNRDEFEIIVKKGKVEDIKQLS